MYQQRVGTLLAECYFGQLFFGFSNLRVDVHWKCTRAARNFALHKNMDTIGLCSTGPLEYTSSGRPHLFYIRLRPAVGKVENLNSHLNSKNPWWSSSAMKSPVMSSRSPVRKRMPSQASGRNSISSWTCLYAAWSAGNASQLWPVKRGDRTTTSATKNIQYLTATKYR